MIQIKHLTITHRKDLRVLVEDFSFSLQPGDRAVMIGEEGNGKSTILKWLYEPELVGDYAEADGERILSGERPGYLPQELSAEDRQKSVYEFFCEEEAFLEQTPRELAKLAAELGVEAEFYYRDQKMATLSGGEKVKAQMARILMTQPTALLLDEPSNDIDIETLEWLERLILRSETPVLFISHDETLIERTANVVIHIEQIRRKTESRITVARTDYRTYCENRAAQLTRQADLAANERKEEKKRQEKFRRLEQQVQSDLRAVSRQDPHGGYLLKKKMKAVKSMERRYEREAAELTERPETEEAIFFKLGEDVKMPAGKTVLDYHLDRLETPSDENGESRILAEEINLRIRGGEKVAIIGANGAGKTTLLKKLAAELLARKDICAAYMPQNYEELLDLHQTPTEYLAVTGDREEETRIRTYLGSLKFTADEMAHRMAELSGGQKAKILLLKMSMSGADVLILDEPTRNFSPLSGPVIRRMLCEYQGAVISISHDRKYLNEVCTKVYRLEQDGLHETRKAEENV